MTTARLSIQKTALYNAFTVIQQDLKNAQEELDGRQNPNEWVWPTADSAKTRRLAYEKVRYLTTILEELSKETAPAKRQRKVRADSQGGTLEKQKTRLLLVICPECEYKARITSLWIDIGIPKCPNPDCGSFDQTMTQEFGTKDGEPEAIDVTIAAKKHAEKKEVSPMTDEEKAFFEKAGQPW